MGLKEEIEDMKKEVKDIQEHSFAMELLHDARKTNKRQFIIILVILAMFTALLGYTIWLLNDINYVETSEVYDMNTENGNVYERNSKYEIIRRLNSSLIAPLGK